jgi:hypothetical protein
LKNLRSGEVNGDRIVRFSVSVTGRRADPPRTSLRETGHDPKPTFPIPPIRPLQIELPRMLPGTRSEEILTVRPIEE